MKYLRTTVKYLFRTVSTTSMTLSECEVNKHASYIQKYKLYQTLDVILFYVLIQTSETYFTVTAVLSWTRNFTVGAPLDLDITEYRFV